ncbi:hypothetical protein PybrP1_006107 [[Pythium] brassicae (nom. inval.)]|nr:hypothetical protein PybrP1_006107 [[Pythium] brassicae (nom. inval.)]
MHLGHALSKALVLLLAAEKSEQPPAAAFSSPQHATPPYSAGVCDNPAIASLPFCDGALPLDARVDDLVARIPLDEAFGLLVDNASRADSVHLPPYGWWSEALHGVALSPAVTFGVPTPVATSFPQVVSVAAAFNRTLFYKIGEAISTEARPRVVSI